jgi:hypothetical protein
MALAGGVFLPSHPKAVETAGQNPAAAEVEHCGFGHSLDAQGADELKTIGRAETFDPELCLRGGERNLLLEL